MIFHAINTIKFVLTKQILKEYLPCLKQFENFRFKDELLKGKRIPNQKN